MTKRRYKMQGRAKTFTVLTVVFTMITYLLNIMSCIGLFGEDSERLFTNASVGIILSSLVGIVLCIIFVKTVSPLALCVSLTVTAAVTIGLAILIYSTGMEYASVNEDGIFTFLRNKCLVLLPVAFSYIRLAIMKIRDTKISENDLKRVIRTGKEDDEI